MDNSTMKIGVMAEALGADARQAAALARSMQFQGVLFNAYSPTFSIPDLSQTGRREFRQVLGAQQIELIGLRGDLGAKGFGPGADIDRLLHQIDRAMEAAAGLGAARFCVDLGPLPEPAREKSVKSAITAEQAGLLILPTATVEPEPASPEKPVDQRFMDSVQSAMQEVAVRADRYNVAVAFSSSLASFAASEHAIQSARSSWFGVDLDPVAILRDDWEIDEIFSRMGSSIFHVRAHDALSGSDRRTKPAIIGTGSVDWAELLARLDQSAYQGWVTVDPMEMTDRVEGARKGLSYLRKTVSLK